MGLESATYIHQLNPLNPVGAVDPKAQGDDHIRLIKSAIQATFSNITGPVTVTQAQLNAVGGSGITGFGVPTVKVKATGAAGAGAATTGIRSDAQLLLDLTDAYAWTGQHSWPNGTLAAPTFTFGSDLDIGLFRIGANNPGMSVGNLLAMEWFNNGGNAQALISNGSAGAPSLGFSSDTDLGVYRVGANLLGFTCTQIQSPDGAAATPMYSFVSDPGSGVYRDSAGSISIANGSGTVGLTIRSSSLILGSASTLIVRDGSAANPNVTFFSDQDTGFYRDTANQIGIGLGGATAGQIAQGSFTGTLTGFAAGPTGTVNYQRVGNIVHLWFPAAITGTSNATTMTMTGLPAIIRPTTTMVGFGINVTDNGNTNLLGSFNVNSSGVLTLSPVVGMGGANTFTNTGTKGISIGAQISYPIG